MTGPADLLELGTPYALNAVTSSERADIDRQLAAAPRAVAAAFDDEVRAVRETMAVLSSAVRADATRRPRWRAAILAAAAAIVVALAAFGAGIALRPAHVPTMAEQIISAPDVRTASTPMAGGTATVVFSRDMNGAVLVMDNVPPPSQGTVYQMWLVGDNGAQSAGTMNAAAITPSTTHTFTSLKNSNMLAFTVEPGDGSPQPTGKIFAKLPLN